MPARTAVLAAVFGFVLATTAMCARSGEPEEPDNANVGPAGEVIRSAPTDRVTVEELSEGGGATTQEAAEE